MQIGETFFFFFLNGLPSRDTHDEAFVGMTLTLLYFGWPCSPFGEKSIRNEELRYALARCRGAGGPSGCRTAIGVVRLWPWGNSLFSSQLLTVQQDEGKNQCSLEGFFMIFCVDFNSCFGRVRELWGALLRVCCPQEPRCCQHNCYTSVLPPPSLSPETGIVPIGVLLLPTTGSSPED